MARVAIAGAGVVGASIAYHLALAGADGIVLADTGTVASGATGKALGGVRQQFSSAPEVLLARESVAFFRSLGPPLFDPVGYLFLATTEAGRVDLEERRDTQRALGVPVEPVDPSFVPGLEVGDVLGASYCAEDGVADPAGVTRWLVRRAVELGVELREFEDGRSVEAETLVLAAGANSATIAVAFDIELPVRPLVRQLSETAPIRGLQRPLPLTIESESTFHFRRRGEALVLAMAEPEPRWGFDALVDDSLVAEWRSRLARRYPSAAAVPVARTWAGLYDMTPDAHPIIGPVGAGLYVACGFSGHGFMQAPAVGRIVADELLGIDPGFDLSPYRLERFAGGAVFPETAIL
ncbi:MAG: NAD(P)/FAD-dependent oxidoreductase [Gaiella sp.]